MYKLKDFLSIIEEYAPLVISQKAIEDGEYDNSGIIVHSHDAVQKTLFSLDLSVLAVQESVRLGVDTIITHHPAIYNPIKNLDKDGETAGLLLAIKSGLNVISMHLNLDMADKGVDFYTAEGLGAKDIKIIRYLGDTEYGYGREFLLSGDAQGVKSAAEKTFGTDKIVLYGSGKVEKVASFCGGGSGHALSAVESGSTNADLIVTSDMPHHVLKELIERGKKVMLIPHYVSEQYGFRKFYEWTKSRLGKEQETHYFEDKRFM